jgi:hypothetical protein
MQRIFQLLKIKRSARNKSLSTKGSISGNKAYLESDIKSYATMPKTFDFTAYFDDNESGNIPNDNEVEIPPKEVNTEIICMGNEKYATKFFSTENQGFECCIN